LYPPPYFGAALFSIFALDNLTVSFVMLSFVMLSLALHEKERCDESIVKSCSGVVSVLVHNLLTVQSYRFSSKL
jgi:hypothetical protein